MRSLVTSKVPPVFMVSGGVNEEIGGGKEQSFGIIERLSKAMVKLRTYGKYPNKEGDVQDIWDSLCGSSGVRDRQ